MPHSHFQPFSSDRGDSLPRPRRRRYDSVSALMTKTFLPPSTNGTPGLRHKKSLIPLSIRCNQTSPSRMFRWQRDRQLCIEQTRRVILVRKPPNSV
ncbi:hypothetical protein JMJ77_0011943 [Colletotrichum scovillei]|uniref:Uncharacterized protein n=1 Tax=Colletotrichum scovillei TaxID=1209932 RepID=A0A9P7UDI7_9PEZI|nr:hypothetical protein JMJ77_0011943 [Colletotrichum scovillei]KAG7046227.1 hypothetical protein JMJ78_0011293 [Colletotrichum scovillei]KAG7063576.1 hypothetical protein JMJ76_0006038 [Colletotrichum scovillei]